MKTQAKMLAHIERRRLRAIFGIAMVTLAIAGVDANAQTVEEHSAVAAQWHVAAKGSLGIGKEQVPFLVGIELARDIFPNWRLSASGVSGSGTLNPADTDPNYSHDSGKLTTQVVSLRITGTELLPAHFELSIGAEIENIKYQMAVTHLRTGDKVVGESAIVNDDLTVALGHSWDLGSNMSVHVDWVEYAIPVKSSVTNKVARTVGTSVAPQYADTNIRYFYTTATAGEVRLLTIAIGYSF